MVYTLSGVHKLYTSHLIAVMVKVKKVKGILYCGNWEKSKNCRALGITGFTAFLNSKKIAVAAQFCISSRSAGGSRSQKRDKKQVSSQKRKTIKQHFWYNFTRHSQNVNEETLK
jgi:hypothetical protein